MPGWAARLEQPGLALDAHSPRRAPTADRPRERAGKVGRVISILGGSARPFASW